MIHVFLTGKTSKCILNLSKGKKMLEDRVMTCMLDFFPLSKWWALFNHLENYSLVVVLMLHSCDLRKKLKHALCAKLYENVLFREVSSDYFVQFTVKKKWTCSFVTRHLNKLMTKYGFSLKNWGICRNQIW